MAVWDSGGTPATPGAVTVRGSGSEWAGFPYPASTTAEAVAANAMSGQYGPLIDRARSSGSASSEEEVAYGFENMPGGKGYTVGTGDSPSMGSSPIYRGSADYDVWKSWGERRIIRQKKKLWLAGYYEDPPIFNGAVLPNDIAAMRSAMTEANLNSQRWEDAIRPRLMKGIEAGTPFDPEDYLPGADGPEGATTGSGGAQEAAARRVAFSTSKAQLRTLASNNGVKLPRDYVQKMAHQIARGNTTYEVVAQDIRNRTIAETYPAYADRIKAGEDMVDIAHPYRQAYMSILEEEPDMDDPALKRALQAVGEDGKPTTVPLWQFEQQLKEDPRWGKTDNAWDEVGGRTMALMQMFGMQP